MDALCPPSSHFFSLARPPARPFSFSPHLSSPVALDTTALLPRPPPAPTPTPDARRQATRASRLLSPDLSRTLLASTTWRSQEGRSHARALGTVLLPSTSTGECVYPSSPIARLGLPSPSLSLAWCGAAPWEATHRSPPLQHRLARPSGACRPQPDISSSLSPALVALSKNTPVVDL
ncbi:hypothetical protein EJ04DRAFT_213080 [Polyplosphaeria fusca]|uniref:Uncharacterized protein n=1 Tax=Polyplosphaeria fusca TaxID=682080 RepID=A0A9P4R7V4_9PLEO|nr:hypothetical protein EJ04DRAFT_213080 [Polyplosphaeria fusca]